MLLDLRYKVVRFSASSFTLAAALVLTGCAGLAGEASKAKIAAIQLPLTALPDGQSFDWALSSDAGGVIRIERTFTKGQTVCRLVTEDEKIGDRSESIIATYCLNSQGDWK